MDPIYVGIDPSLRHTGVCLWAPGQKPIFHEIRTHEVEVVSAGRSIAATMEAIWKSYIAMRPAIFCIERQLPDHGLLFYAHMVVLESIYWKMIPRINAPWLANPLPVQLKSYINKKLFVSTETKKATVEGIKALEKLDERISQHLAEAYCLARMARDVSIGEWKFNLPSKETHLVNQLYVFGEKQ